MAVVERGEVELGLAILQNSVWHEPNNVALRKRLREVAHQVRLKNGPPDKDLILIEGRSEIHLAKRNQDAAFVDWPTILRAAERGLSVCPEDVDLHLELGHACHALGYREAAIYAYTNALEIQPDRQEISGYLANMKQSTQGLE